MVKLNGCTLAAGWALCGHGSSPGSSGLGDSEDEEEACCAASEADVSPSQVVLPGNFFQCSVNFACRVCLQLM